MTIHISKLNYRDESYFNVKALIRQKARILFIPVRFLIIFTFFVMYEYEVRKKVVKFFMDLTIFDLI